MQLKLERFEEVQVIQSEWYYSQLLYGFNTESKFAQMLE